MLNINAKLLESFVNRILNQYSEFSSEFKPPKDKLAKAKRILGKRYRNHPDPWGLDIEKTINYVHILYPLYKQYFKVRVFNSDKVQDNNFLFVSNHTGQIAFDGVLLSITGLLELTPPRILRGMAERWMAMLPFIAKYAATGGSILGDRTNCEFLLTNNESIMVFPEGVKGIAKSTNEFYEMKPFTLGFYRMALKTKTAILPTAIIGAEEAYPFVYQAKGLAKKLGIPALPITPTFPFFGPLGFLPLPSPIDIYFGAPIIPDYSINPDCSDEKLRPLVNIVQEEVKKLLTLGLKNRRPFLDRFGVPVKRELK